MAARAAAADGPGWPATAPVMEFSAAVKAATAATASLPSALQSVLPIQQHYCGAPTKKVLTGPDRTLGNGVVLLHPRTGYACQAKPSCPGCPHSWSPPGFASQPRVPRPAVSPGDARSRTPATRRRERGRRLSRLEMWQIQRVTDPRRVRFRPIRACTASATRTDGSSMSAKPRTSGRG